MFGPMTNFILMFECRKFLLVVGERSCAMLNFNDCNPHCHPERSEGSGCPTSEILRQLACWGMPGAVASRARFTRCAQSLRKTRSDGMRGQYRSWSVIFIRRRTPTYTC